MLRDEGICNHLWGQVRLYAIVGTVVFLEGMDSELNRHLAACVSDRAGQHQARVSKYA